VAEGGGRRQQLRSQVGGNPGLGGRALPRARAVRHDGPGRRHGPRDRAGREGLRGGLVPHPHDRAALRRARRLPGDRAQLPAGRSLRVPPGLERARRYPASAGSGPQPAAHRQGRSRRLLSGRDRPGDRRGDAAHRRLSPGERPGGIRAARGRAPDHEVPPARARVLSRCHRRADRGRDAEHPRPVPVREGRVRDAGGLAPARGGDSLRFPRPAAAPGRPARGAGAVARTRLERARPGGGGGSPAPAARPSRRTRGRTRRR
jgi:hypothetical protein